MKNPIKIALAVLVAGAAIALSKPVDEAVYNIMTKRHRELAAQIAKYDPTFENYKPNVSSGAGGAGYGIGGGPFIGGPSICELEKILENYQK